MVEMAIEIAEACNEQYFVCRFITIDAAIEHNESILNFYLKNGRNYPLTSTDYNLPYLGFSNLRVLFGKMPVIF
jgi:hypothetical protein